MVKKNKNNRGDFLFDIRVFNLPNGGIVDNLKLDSKIKDWEIFLKKFGIDIVKGKKDEKIHKPRRNRTIFDTE